ncbi:MAG: asparagine--tRNA ligase [archaeon]|nr:asparagine--tRNA ligase [archaeon]
MEKSSKVESRLVSDEERESLEKLLSELHIEDKNSPDAPIKPLRSISFSGRIRIAALFEDDHEKWIDKTITLGGWAKSIRTGGNKEFCFIDLNDGSSVRNFQAIIMKEVSNFEEVCKEGIGSSFLIRGKIVKSPGGKQSIELRVDNTPGLYCKILGSCKLGEYPLMTGKEAKKMKLETLRDICHLRPRTNIISCVTRIRNNLAYATHIYFQNRGFQYIHTPLITSSDCEGAGSMFQVTTLFPSPNEKVSLKTTPEGLVDYKDDFFSKPTYLTVSGQLAVENYACALSDVYTFGPTFRAEVSHTSRHLAEFWMIEPEMCFADIYDDMECGENYLKFCLKYVLENNKADLEFLEKQVEKGLIQRLKTVIDNDFKRLSYTEAIDILKEAVSKNKKLFIEDSKESSQELRNIYWGMDMASPHERYLTETVFKKPVIVYNYPKEIKSFYMKLNSDGKTVAAMDILVPKIGEIIGGSQREENYELLSKRIDELKMDIKGYWWYLDLRKFGTVPHSGFGLGFERLVMMATGIENIRDVIPYPRYPGHADF